MPVALTAAVVAASIAQSAAVIAVLGTIGASIAGALAAYAINAAFARKPSTPDLSAVSDLSNRSQTLTGLGAAVSRQLVYGEVVKGGTVVFRHASDEIGSATGSENAVIPTTAPYTVTVSHAADATEDLGATVQTIIYYEQAVDENGTPYQRPLEEPAYEWTPASYTHNAGTYTFTAADAGKSVRIQYRYKVVSIAHNRLNLVIVLAGHECEAIGDIYFDDEIVPLTPSGHVASGKFANHVYVEKYLGTNDQAASGALIAKSSGKWTSEHRLRGHAYIYVELIRNVDIFPGGVPNIKADIKGKKVYDPVTGVTAWSANAALCIADYLNDQKYGLGAPYATEIDTDALIAARNICNEGVPLAAGGTEARYLCNGIIDTSQTPQDVLEKMLTSLSGRLVYSGGKWHVRAGAYLSPAVTLDEDDVRGPISVKTRLSRQEVFNGVKGLYVSPQNHWQPSDFPPVTNATYLAEDGGEQVWFEMDLPFTTSASMAQRIAKIELEKVRQQQTAAVQFKLRAYQVEPPETVMFSNTVMGWDAKPFEVVESALAVEQDPEGAPVLVINMLLRETAAAVYDWNSGEETRVDPAPDTNLPSPFVVYPPGTPVVTEELYQAIGSSGVHTKARITWDASPDGQARRYDLQWKARDAADWSSHPGLTECSDEIVDLAPGLYLWRVRALNTLGVASQWAQTETDIRGLLAPPADLSGFAVQSYGGLARFTWDKHPDLDVRAGGRIFVRWSPLLVGATWNQGSLINQNGYSGDTTIGFGPLQTGTYMAKVVDSTGHACLGVAVFVATEALVTGFTTLASISYDPLFAGTRTHTVVVDSSLQLAGSALWDSVPGDVDDWALVDYLGGVQSSGSCLFTDKLDLGDSITARLFSTIDSEAFDTADLWDARTDPIDTWGLVDGSVIEDAEVTLMVRTTNDDPNGASPTWGEWHDLGMVGDYSARGFELRADFTSANATHNRRLTELRVAAKVEVGGAYDPTSTVIYDGPELVTE